MSPLLPRPLPLAGLAWLTGFRRVPDNAVVTKHRFGRFVGALGPGWHWTLPGLDSLGQPVCLIGHHLDIAAEPGTHAELYYQILDPAQMYVAIVLASVLGVVFTWIVRFVGRRLSPWSKEDQGSPMT